ncbi:GntR family transcriptional regulator [Azospirillum sp. ST 5-10]|uniref:GntR family transcriptional regulator n=1 Tax=unclassified Azospirillum TaxID=2630922 RepID=UPI003F4A1A50
MSRHTQIVLKLREMILSGALQAGERVTEIPIATQLGVSRTPVRYALGILSREGLVVPTDNRRGFVVRAFTLKDIDDAIRVRGLLEGMAAREIAEAGPTPDLQAELRACVAEGARLIAKGRLGDEDDVAWSETNGRFHDLIVEGSGNRALIHALRINDQVPFASAKAFLDDRSDVAVTRRQFDVLFLAQKQHEAVFQALCNRQGSRAEALMREHSHVAMDNIRLFRTAITQPPEA